jgi:peptidoglycan/LPS O-acetylase OafA/YrhL
MTLPADHSSHQWRLAWSGFDVALSLAFACAAFVGWRRRQLAVTALTVLGVLLLCDAWFDVTLSWGTSEQTASILTALFAELPVAVLAIGLAHRLLRETVHYVWHLEGREHPVPRLRQLPAIFVGTDAR